VRLHRDSRKAAQVALVAALLGAALVASAFLTRDPEAQFFDVTFVNDTPGTVHLSLCADDRCRSIAYTDQLGRGASVTEQASDARVRTTWMIRARQGGRASCISRVFNRRRPQTIRLSTATTCQVASA
jgi:hypothetical protein